MSVLCWLKTNNLDCSNLAVYVAQTEIASIKGYLNEQCTLQQFLINFDKNFRSVYAISNIAAMWRDFHCSSDCATGLSTINCACSKWLCLPQWRCDGICVLVCSIWIIWMLQFCTSIFFFRIIEKPKKSFVLSGTHTHSHSTLQQRRRNKIATV